jgi:hypothetical protein
MTRRTVVVNDKMQRGYRYQRGRRRAAISIRSFVPS